MFSLTGDILKDLSEEPIEQVKLKDLIYYLGLIFLY